MMRSLTTFPHKCPPYARWTVLFFRESSFCDIAVGRSAGMPWSFCRPLAQVGTEARFCTYWMLSRPPGVRCTLVLFDLVA